MSDIITLTTFRLPKTLLKKLKNVCTELELSQQELIVSAIKAYISAIEKEQGKTF